MNFSRKTVLRGLVQ